MSLKKIMFTGRPITAVSSAATGLVGLGISVFAGPTPPVDTFFAVFGCVMLTFAVIETWLWLRR